MERRSNKHHKLKSKPFPAGKLIGIKLTDFGTGTATCSLKVQKKHMNPLGSLHGGILCDLADATMGYAFLSHFPSKKKGVAIHFQISFLKAVRTGTNLRCTAATVSHGRNLYFMESAITNDVGHLIAKATSTCKKLR